MMRKRVIFVLLCQVASNKAKEEEWMEEEVEKSSERTSGKGKEERVPKSAKGSDKGM